MPDPHDHNSTPGRRDADQLGLVWNALVCGDVGAIETLESEDAAVIRRLGALASTPRPRRHFADRLKEHLMDTTVSVPAIGVAQPLPLLSVVPTMVAPVPVGNRRRGQRFLDGSRRGLGVVATVALIAVTLLGGYLAILSPRPGGDGLRGAVGGTPVSGANVWPDCDNYGPLCPTVQNLGWGFVYKPNYAAAELGARNVQLQNWSVDPGARIEVAGDATAGARGAVVDVVIEGVYVVTIDAPAVVTRARLPMEKSVDYLPPGTVAELGRGDAISYPAGRARTIVNPLVTTTLLVKSAVFSDGDVTLTRPADPQPAGLSVRIDGDGVLPRPLADYQTNEIIVTLDYIQVRPEIALPSERSGQQRIIGPVDPVQPDIEEGYVLWVGESRG